MLLLLLPTSITQWHSKQGMYTGEMVGGLGRVLEVRCSYYISQQCFFFFLFLFFFPAVQCSCLTFSVRSITSSTSFLQSGYLARFSLCLFRLLHPHPIFAQLNLALVLVNTLLFFLALSLIYQDCFEQ